MDTYFKVKIEMLAEKGAPLPDAKFTWQKITDQPEPGLVNGDVVQAPEGLL